MNILNITDQWSILIHVFSEWDGVCCAGLGLTISGATLMAQQSGVDGGITPSPKTTLKSYSTL